MGGLIMIAFGVLIVGVTLVFILVWHIHGERRDARRLNERLKRL